MKYLRSFIIILAIIAVSCGTSFATIKWTNNASSTLAAGISAGATSITVATGEGDEFPAVAAPHYFMLTLVDSAGRREIVKCTARTALSDTMTIVRAQESTTARAYVTGNVVSLRVTQSSLDFFSKSVDANAHIYIADPSETDQGAVGSGGSIKDLLNTIGTSKRATIVLPHLAENAYTTTTYTLGTTLDASSYTAVTLVIQPGAKIDCVTSAFTWSGNTIAQGENAFGNDTGYTITLQTVDAGNYRIFDNLSGNAVINKSPIKIEWYGVLTSASGADNSAYFIKAVAGIPVGGSELSLSNSGSYSVSGEVEIGKSNVSIEFGKGVLINGIAGAANFLKISGVQGAHISNVKISGLHFNGRGVSGYPITVNYTDGVSIYDCYIDKSGVSGIHIANSTGEISKNYISESTLYNIYLQHDTTGSTSNSLKNLIVSENRSYTPIVEHMLISGVATAFISHVNVLDNIFSGGDGLTYNIVAEYAESLIFRGNQIINDATTGGSGQIGIDLRGVKNSIVNGNYIKSPDISINFQDVGGKYCTNNLISGNLLEAYTTTATVAIREYTPTGNSNFNIMAGNHFLNYTRADYYELVGSNSSVTEINYIVNNSATTASGAALSTLKTFTIGGYELGSAGALRITVGGTNNCGSANGDIDLNFGSTNIPIQAATTTLPWSIVIDIYNTSLTTQQIITRGSYSGAFTIRNSTTAIDSKSDIIVSITGEPGNPADSITCNLFHVERLK